MKVQSDFDKTLYLTFDKNDQSAIIYLDKMTNFPDARNGLNKDEHPGELIY